MSTLKESPNYFLGIDGGASKTEFLLADIEGNALCRHFEGSCNPVDIGMNAAQEVLGKGIRKCCQGISFNKISMFAGISGGIVGNNRARFREFFESFSFARIDNGSDAQLIITAGLGNRDGMAVIMGTGSVAFVQKDGELSRIGGMGYLFDDGGNGFCIGRDVIRAALQCEDGSGEGTLLHRLVTQKVGNPSAIKALSNFYDMGKRGIASYAPLAFEAYEEGDAIARDILHRNMEPIVRLLQTGRRKLESEHVNAVFVGGLINRWDILLPEILAQLPDAQCFDLSVYTGKPVDGALTLAGLKEGIKNDQN